MSFDTEAVLEVFFLVNAEKKKSVTLSLDLRIVWLHTTHICHFCALFRIKLRPSCGFQQKTVSHVGYRDKLRKGKRDTCCLEHWRGGIKPQIYTLCGPDSVGSQGSDGRMKEKKTVTIQPEHSRLKLSGGKKREITWLSLLSTQAGKHKREHVGEDGASGERFVCVHSNGRPTFPYSYPHYMCVNKRHFSQHHHKVLKKWEWILWPHLCSCRIGDKCV